MYLESLVDTSEVKTSFSIKLTAEQWRLVIEKTVFWIDDEQITWFKGSTRTYGDCLATAFNEINKSCLLSFNKITVRKPHQVNHAFVRIHATCKGPECKVNYVLTVHDKPEEDASEVVMHVKKTSKWEIKHYQSDHLHRPL